MLFVIVASPFGFIAEGQQANRTPPPPPPPSPAGMQQRPRRVSSQPATVTPGAAASEEVSGAVEVDEDDVLEVTTNLVSVPIVVTNHTGQPLTNLSKADFRLYEDNQRQEVAEFRTIDAPFEVALLLDTSGSTREELYLIRRAANAFIDSLRPGDRVAIVSFTTKRDEGERLAEVEVRTTLTDNREVLREALQTIGASNGTPFYDALEQIATKVFGGEPRPEVRGRQAIVALTDGVDSTSYAEFDEARDALIKRGVLCYFVEVNTETFVENRLLQDCSEDGRLALSRAQMQRYRRIFAPYTDAGDFMNFCQLGQFQRMQISRDLYNLARKEMNELARASGGKTFQTIDLRDARRAFAEVARAIGTQYSIGYYSSNKTRDGRFRRIRVEVPRVQGAQVRAREGYNAPTS